MHSTLTTGGHPGLVRPRGEPWPPLGCPTHPDAGLDYTAGSPARYMCPSCRAVYRVDDGIPLLVRSEVSRRDDFRAEAAQWDKEAELYDARRARDPRYMAAVRAAVRSVAAGPGMTVLDAGCGTGLTTRRLVAAGCRVAALDMSVESLARLRGGVGNAEAHLVQGDLTELPFASGSFDRVLCANAIQQVEGDARRRACVRELARVLRPGGRLVVTAQQYSVPRRRAGWAKEGPTGDRVRYVYRFLKTELVRLFEAGASGVRVRGAGFPLPYRFKLGLFSSGVEVALGRIGPATPLADMLVATVVKPGGAGSHSPER